LLVEWFDKSKERPSGALFFIYDDTKKIVSVPPATHWSDLFERVALSPTEQEVTLFPEGRLFGDRFAPRFPHGGRPVFGSLVGHRGQGVEDLLEISCRSALVSPASALPKNKPVLFSDGCPANGIFNRVVVDLQVLPVFSTASSGPRHSLWLCPSDFSADGCVKAEHLDPHICERLEKTESTKSKTIIHTRMWRC
jgi:hypothetical protein